MHKKILIGLELIIILVAAFIYITYKAIPEYESTLGSSDTLINTKNFQDIIEFKLNNLNFAIIINKKNKISNILFFDSSAIILYNQNIENLTISKGISKIMNILNNNNYLEPNFTLNLINYNNKSYNEVKYLVTNYFTTNNFQINISESNSSLQKKAKQLNIEEAENTTELLTLLDFYSKDLIKNYTSKNSSKNEISLPKDMALIYANNVYSKLEDYITSNNIDNLQITDTILPINLIPADENGKYYPSSDSWYYVLDKKIYAYIKFSCESSTCSYCYNGNINLVKEGECS